MRYKQYFQRTLLGLGSGRLALAQRPGNESICDYYAIQRYASNTSTTQFQLIQSIVGLAYVGGNDVPGAPDNSTGIFNNSTFGGFPVYLRPWFDGSKQSSNQLGSPIAVDWLNGGGLDPIVAFLNDSRGSIELTSDSNQEYVVLSLRERHGTPILESLSVMLTSKRGRSLFNHWYTAFGHIYGCTLVSSFPTTSTAGGQTMDVAYTHKFMDLNSSDVGYFIEQITVASQFYGFSSQDATTLSGSLNAKYNVRCSPAVDGMLYSICQDTECPLAEPSADCDAYVNIQPTASSAASSSPAASSATSSGTTSGSDSSSSGQILSGGDIAGISIGGAAVILLAVGLWLYYRRHHAKLVPVPVQQNGGQMSPAPGPYSTWSPHTQHHASTVPSSVGLHDSYISGVSTSVGANGQPGSPGIWSQHNYKPPQEMSDTGVERRYPSPGPRTPELQHIAEMESPDYRDSHR